MANPFDTMLRRAVLAAAESHTLERLVKRHGRRFGAARFVAGESFEEAVDVLRRLNDQGLRTNTTLLGEHVSTAAEAAAVVETYTDILAGIDAAAVQTNVALKLTHLGLVFDEALAYRNVLALADVAGSYGNFIRIDMEESRHVDATLRIFRRLREAGRDNVGVVLQSCLRRSERDLGDMLDLVPNVRIVKGAYLEPAEIAYPDKRDVDEAYRRLMERSLTFGGFTAIATHDTRLIDHAVSYTTRERLHHDRFQFQMLYGVRPKLQVDLARRGYDVLVATPFGPDWYRYLMRRLAERPANLLFFLRHLVRG